MEIEMEVADVAGVLLDRLNAAAAALEEAAARMAQVELQAASGREAELEARLAQAEATVASLQAAAHGRKTASAVTLLARDGQAVEAGALDAALASLSVEQRIAVKAQMLRRGLLG